MEYNYLTLYYIVRGVIPQIASNIDIWRQRGYN